MPELINKKDLVERFAEQFDTTKKDATVQIQYLLDEITAELQKGNSVDLSGFGRFVMKVKPAREGYNPATRTKITVAEKKTVSFRPAKALKESL